MTHSRYQFNPHTPAASFRQLTLDEYQQQRSHPERPIKSRRSMFVCLKETAQKIDGLISTGPSLDSRRLILNGTEAIKFIGFNHGFRDRVASTGTSQRNTLCLTDGFGQCIGVAMGGTRDSHTSVPAAKVRLFHLFCSNVNAVEDIASYLKKLKNAQFDVEAALYGGDRPGIDAALGSDAYIARLRTLFAENQVPLVFDEACDKRPIPSHKPLGVMITDRAEIRFITELRSAEAYQKSNSD